MWVRWAMPKPPMATAMLLFVVMVFVTLHLTLAVEQGQKRAAGDGPVVAPKRRRTERMRAEAEPTFMVADLLEEEDDAACAPGHFGYPPFGFGKTFVRYVSRQFSAVHLNVAVSFLVELSNYTTIITSDSKDEGRIRRCGAYTTVAFGTAAKTDDLLKLYYEHLLNSGCLRCMDNDYLHEAHDLFPRSGSSTIADEDYNAYRDKPEKDYKGPLDMLLASTSKYDKTIVSPVQLRYAMLDLTVKLLLAITCYTQKEKNSITDYFKNVENDLITLVPFKYGLEFSNQLHFASFERIKQDIIDLEKGVLNMISHDKLYSIYLLQCLNRIVDFSAVHSESKRSAAILLGHVVKRLLLYSEFDDATFAMTQLTFLRYSTECSGDSTLFVKLETPRNSVQYHFNTLVHVGSVRLDKEHSAQGENTNFIIGTLDYLLRVKVHKMMSINLIARALTWATVTLSCWDSEISSMYDLRVLKLRDALVQVSWRVQPIQNATYNEFDTEKFDTKFPLKINY